MAENEQLNLKGEKMPGKSQLKSHQIFHIVRKTLSDGIIHDIFGKSSRLIYMWAADPRHCEFTRRNPLDQIKEMFDALDDYGRDDVVLAALEYMAGDLPFTISSDTATAVSDKGCVDGEVADLAVALGHLSEAVRDAVSDKTIEADELIRIKRSAMEMKRGVDELLDAAGIRSGS